MLRELHISNLAVIEDANIEFESGLNVFTGQTGAGKSLIIGAFELLLGLRSGGAGGAGLIRTGCDEARVTGLFELSCEQTAQEMATILDRPVSVDEGLLITRRLFATGRSSVSINGAPATVSMLQQVGEYLVDIHGQHDQQYLLKPSNQLRILDAFGQSNELRQQFSDCYDSIRVLQQKREDLLASEATRKQQLELYEFQADEIDAAAPQPGEFSTVQHAYTRLANVGRLKQEATAIQAGLYESDGAAVEQLELVCRQMSELVALDSEHIEPINQQIIDATEIIRDAAYELSRYADSLDLAPGELMEAESRLDTLNHLIHKYGEGKKAATASEGDPVAAVLAYRKQIGEQLDALQQDDADLSQLDFQITEATTELTGIGSQLSEARRAAAKRLAPLVEKQLQELGMAEATFAVQLTSMDADNPNMGPSGLEQIEFVVQTNPGQAAHPLRRIASGGETSRIMLALKSILANSDRVSVLVFDEIDSNIGGRLGSVIGKKMRQLANGQSVSATSGKVKHKQAANSRTCQVLCITHLPQIAAFGDHHLHIAKAVSASNGEKATHTTVMPLDGEARIRELAEMMTGEAITDTALAQAEELLQLAIDAD